MKKLIFGLLVTCLLPFSGAWAQEYSNGNGYTTIENPVRTTNSDKIEVLEIFWYGCPHCYALEEYTQAWKQKLPEDVDFKFMPAALNRSWLAHAKAFYVADILGIEDELHSDLFNAIHQERRRLNKEDDLAEFFTDYGVTEDDFKKQYNSFAVQSRLAKADAKLRAYGVRGVPGLVVNGKYLVTAETAGGNKYIYDVVDYLVEQERQKQ